MMTSYFNLLKYAATGIASPDMTYYDRMRASTLMGGAVQTLTGIPPLSFKSNGSPLISWSMLGNGSQQGTPTPDNPLMPDFVGVRTANLFDEDYSDIIHGLKYRAVYVGDGTFTLSTTMPTHDVSGTTYTNLFFLSGDVSSGANTNTNGVWLDNPRTAQSINGYVTICYRDQVISPADYKTMLNSGSTALPYEPYGYTIPISCGGTTQTVYLTEPLRKIGDYVDVVSSDGTVTRRIGKIILTGQETGWGTAGGGAQAYLRLTNTYGQHDAPQNLAVSSHYAVAYTVTSSYVFGLGALTESPTSKWNGNIIFFIYGIGMDAFKSFLAAQYTAGTPVCIWYVLANPVTDTFTVPTIQTTKGQNTLTVDTPIQPSEMTITFKG